MSAVSLLYHDVVDGGLDGSGFTGAGAAIYKLETGRFREHLDALAGSGATARSARTPVTELHASAAPLLLTFDDGGVSAHSRIADLLEERGWIGHFFITAARVGTPGFLDAAQIRDLRARGHLIGAHSWSHPPRISALEPARLFDEWQRCTVHLAGILGHAIETGSVPGGFTSTAVVTAAERAGIRCLFTSEPTTRIHTRGACRVFGRFSILRSTPAHVAADLAAGDHFARQKQWVSWNLRKAAKFAAGPLYHTIRETLLERRVRP